MQIKNLVAALAGMAVVAEAGVTFMDIDSPLSAALAKRQQRGGNRGGNQGNNGQNNNNGGNNNANNNANNGQLCLQTNAVQKGSQSAGTPAAQQAQSATDNANFINFCSGSTLTDGKQITAGSCNGIVMGKIPANTKMVSTALQNPPHNGNIAANQDFDVQLKVNNLAAGSFTDAQATYYSAPQNVNGQGQVVGHVHVTIQDMGNSLTPNQPLDASKFVFFKGINDAGDGNGNLKATVTGGLPAGNYRVCTMSSASNHQPVLMPVAQRGAQDDCNKFTVGGNGGNNANANNGGNNNANANNGGNNNANANNGGNANGGQNGGNRGGKQNAGKRAQGGNRAAGAGQRGAGQGAFPGGFPGAQNGGGFPGGQNGGNPFGQGQFPGFGNPGAATSQTQSGQNAQGSADANTSAQDGDAASKPASSATSSVASSTAVPTQTGGASGNSNNNANGNSSGSAGGKGGATSNAILGLAAPAVTDSGDSSRPFSVNGNSFISKANAVQRACDIQRNSCFNAINGGQGNGASTSECDAQVQACIQELS
ncbi:ribosomal protein s17 [Colletotrichum asianum]